MTKNFKRLLFVLNVLGSVYLCASQDESSVSGKAQDFVKFQADVRAISAEIKDHEEKLKILRETFDTTCLQIRQESMSIDRCKQEFNALIQRAGSLKIAELDPILANIQNAK